MDSTSLYLRAVLPSQASVRQRATKEEEEAQRAAKRLQALSDAAAHDVPWLSELVTSLPPAPPALLWDVSSGRSTHSQSSFWSFVPCVDGHRVTCGTCDVLYCVLPSVLVTSADTAYYLSCFPSS